MSRGIKPPGYYGPKIKIICSEKQAYDIKNFGCIACDDDLCDCYFCDRCPYDPYNIEFEIVKENREEELM